MTGLNKGSRMQTGKGAEQSGSGDRLNAALDLIESNPQAAQATFEDLLAADPHDIRAMRGLARALRKLGAAGPAGRLELDAIAAGISRPTFVDAQDAFLTNDLENAEVKIRAHLRSDPQDPAAALMLGEIAARCDAVQEADNLFGRAILLAPYYAEARLALAKHQRATGRFDQAIETLDALLAIHQSNLSALALKASTLEQIRQFDRADETFKLIHELHPDDARSWANHGFMLKTTGRQKEAIEAYRTAIDINPNYGLAWWGLSNLKTVKFDESDIETIRSALGSGGDDPDDRLHLLYALGKALDDVARYEEAFAAYCTGAKLRLEAVPYDQNKVSSHVRKIRQVCTREFFGSRRGWGSKKSGPIFIVSLPRSGSTLIEQILASHPSVEGTEELRDIERIALAIAPEGKTGGWLDVLPRMSADQIEQLGDHYIEATQRHRHTARPFFTDKMPSNWVFTGLIETILPNAKIVDVRRHPMGCGFANFSQHFNWGINYSYDFAHIANFYRNYVEAMAHLDAVLPRKVHHLTYESLIEDTEGEIRRLLDYLGLPFHEDCLRFFENKRAIYTPSSEQVRSPINRDGMERWKNYAPFLSELERELGPVLTHYPDPPPLSR